MKITPSEAMELGIWEDLCEMKGLNVWGVKDGLIDDLIELHLTVGEVRALILGERE